MTFHDLRSFAATMPSSLNPKLTGVQRHRPSPSSSRRFTVPGSSICVARGSARAALGLWQTNRVVSGKRADGVALHGPNAVRFVYTGPASTVGFAYKAESQRRRAPDARHV